MCFVYFSHNLVTLPPPCWTNTAHRHGVKVLGTFITEWDEGKAVCNKLLSTKESAHMYAELLSELAVALGFDGWLLNMEVELELEQIPNLKEFVSHLTQIMHSSLPGSLVIWYDSVTIDGALMWQNQLNDENKPFFDICDGIFLNYSWKESYPRSSAAVAGDRKFDVYMGIDVFGRGTYGGGKWTTNVALDVLKKDDVSAAIFAPGWVYETKQPPDFQTAQNHWWSLVEKSWGAVKFYPESLPFYSNFDQGHGYHISVEGGQVSDAPWNNISSQCFQPFLKFSGNPSPDTIEVFVDFKEASYRGGGNITFKGTLEENTDFTTRIFQGELLLGAVPLHITHSVKSEGDSLLGLALQFSSTANERTSVLLASWGTNQFSRKFSKIIAPCQVNKPRTAPGWAVLESSIEMNGYTLTEIHAVCYRPKHEHAQLRLENRTDGSEATLVYSPKEYHAVIISNGVQGSQTVSVKIDWKSKVGTASRFPKYNIYVEKLSKQAIRDHGVGLGGVQEYLGVANVEAFYVSELPIPATTSSLKFIIQVCGVDGVCQNLDDSPYFQLDVKATTVGGRKMFQLFSYVDKLGNRHFEWFNSPMRERSKAVIRGLLQNTSRMKIRELQRLPSRETKIWVIMILSWMVFVILLCKLSNGKWGKETLVFP
ncbi:hypothetical protein OIU78_005367 [Salix suchowensis]|nr:hypothetical protein OIU78_005367 [Salix suchowensis]